MRLAESDLEDKLRNFTSPSLAVHLCTGKFGSVNIIGGGALGQLLGECSYDYRYRRVTGQAWCFEPDGPKSGSCARARKFFNESTKEKLAEIALSKDSRIAALKRDINFLKPYSEDQLVSREIRELEGEIKSESDKVTRAAHQMYDNMKNFPQWDQTYEIDNKAALEAISQYALNKEQTEQALKEAKITLDEARKSAENGIKDELAKNPEYQNLSIRLTEINAALNEPWNVTLSKFFADYLDKNRANVGGCLIVLPYKHPEPPLEPQQRQRGRPFMIRL